MLRIRTLLFPLLSIAIVQCVAADDGIRVPDGFRITKVAGNELVPNIYSLTIDSVGNPVVAGPGYIRRLLDDDGDGVYDRIQQVSRLPKNGAQGLYFDGPTLYAIGDQGILRLPDPDGDGVAGPPEVVLKVKTGGEHDAHAIRKGPDNHWYLLCGNGVPSREDFYGSKSSPIKRPHAGFLMRMSPDFSEKQILNDGFRNPYDFDFNIDGDIVTYDSDGERDISLPWYQPTRVYRLRHGQNAGWITASWKLSDEMANMPEVIGRLGRGSPTGVFCYRHSAFPKSYFDAAFVLDWTYGRIVAFQRDPRTGEYIDGFEFAAPKGQTAFAVTDAEVAPDGSILVSIGGRGTEGAVYRIEAVETTQPTPAFVQSNSSWARAEFAKSKPQLDWASTIAEINDSKGKLGDQLTLIERTHQTAGELNAEHWAQVKTSNPRLIRRLFWSFSQREMTESDRELAVQLFERALSLEFGQGVEDLLFDLKRQLPANSSFFLKNRKSIFAQPQVPLWIACGQHSIDSFRDIAKLQPWKTINARSSDWPSVFDSYRFDAIENESTRNEMDSFTSQIESSLFVAKGANYRESTRLLAFTRFCTPRIQQHILDQIDEDSDPIADIHNLLVIARIGRGLSRIQRAKIVEGLLAIRVKIESLERNVDRNWPVRMRELTRALIREFRLGQMLATHSELTSPDNFYLVDALANDQKESAMLSIADSILAGNRLPNSDQIRFLASAKENIYCGLIRSFRDEPLLSDAVIRSLARTPIESDRTCFLEGFKSSNRDTWRISAIGLRKLGAIEGSEIPLAAYRKMASLGNDKSDLRVRDELQKLLVNWFRSDFPEVKTFEVSQWQRFLAKQFPNDIAKVTVDSEGSGKRIERLAQLDFSSGSVANGKRVFQKRLCIACHDGGGRLGPSLAGLSSRFSDRDILNSIIRPDDQVPQRYRALKVLTLDGELYFGTVIYESTDGIVMTDRQTNTIRINQEDIDDRAISSRSIMPSGLLDDASDKEIADLMVYLKSLKQ